MRPIKLLAPKNLAEALKDTTKNGFTTVVATAANTDSTKVRFHEKQIPRQQPKPQPTRPIPMQNCRKISRQKRIWQITKSRHYCKVMFKNGNQYIDATTQGGFFMTGNIPDGDYLFFATRVRIR
jgi:hypothetical protein